VTLVIGMPTLSASMETGTVIKWRVTLGENILAGQIIAEIETDKAVMEYESPESGTVLRLLAQAGGAAVAVGAPILELTQATDGTEAMPAQPQATEPVANVAPASDQPPALATPVAKFSQLRRLIAQRVAEAKSTIPHFYVAREMRMDAAMAAITRLRRAGTAEPISINTLILSALARSLQQHPELNVSYAGDGTQALSSVDIGIAIATSEGVFLPVVRQAATRTLADMQSEMARLRTAAERRSLQEHEYSYAAMSLSNLGMHGVDSFAAIISPPQVMMLATGRVAQRPVVVDGAVSPGFTMHCVLSCDHRVIDGVQAARLLATFQDSLNGS
jgi:pyruvate dehydrogenase E2 component (dihydrolipoamide acetyltransferase)